MSGDLRRSTDVLAILSLTLGVAATAWSGSSGLAAALVAASAVSAVGPIVVAGRRHPIARLALGLAAGWMLYGAIIGSLPGTSLTDWRQWVASEGRALLPLLAAATAVSMARFESVLLLLRATVLVIVSSLSVAAVLYALKRDLPGFEIERRGLFFGLASSHHLTGYLTTAVLLTLLACPRLFAVHWRVGFALVCLGSLALSGSRTGMLGLLVGSAVVVAPRLRPLVSTKRGRLQVLACAGVALALVGFAAAKIPRVRDTAQMVTAPAFPNDALTVFRTASTDEAKQRSGTEAEANILLRFAYFGEAWQQNIVPSPLIGIGAFRLNDEPIRSVGPRHLVRVVVEAEPNYGDADAHNLYLQVLAETGIVGSALLGALFLLAWRLARRSVDPGLRAEAAGLASLTHGSIVAVAAMSLVSIGFLGTGLGLVTGVIVFAAGRGVEIERG